MVNDPGKQFLTKSFIIFLKKDLNLHEEENNIIDISSTPGKKVFREDEIIEKEAEKQMKLYKEKESKNQFLLILNHLWILK